MNVPRVDSVIAFALAVAGEADEWFDRQLGPIHLVKYVYLADLAYAKRHGGETFTGANWIFYHFGPWDPAVFARIAPVVARAGAIEHRYSSQYDGDTVRYRLEHPVTSAGNGLPLGVELAVRRGVREFGKDTGDLLNYVYRTRPMLRAAPNERLDFSVVAEPAEDEGEAPVTSLPDTSPPARSDRKIEKRREKATAGLRERVMAKLAERRPVLGRQVVMPAPRYDEVFEQGQEWLDSLAGDDSLPIDIEAEFSDEVWRSRGRADTELP
ncbi:MAG: hypothetical protein WEF50_00450 [Myxococcota bacterium]